MGDRAGDGDEAREEAVGREQRVRLAFEVRRRQRGGGRARAHSEGRVERDAAERGTRELEGTVLHGENARLRPDVEAVPAEREDERSEHHERQRVAGNRHAVAVLIEATATRADHVRAHESGDAAEHVNHGRSREVHVPHTAAMPKADPTACPR